MVTEQTATVATLTEAWAGGGMADAPQVAVAGTMEAVPDPVQEDYTRGVCATVVPIKRNSIMIYIYSPARGAAEVTG